jgi:uncharacterized coiled-coil DUF342 family protein
MTTHHHHHQQQLKRLLALHEGRVLAYKRWEKAFREYISMEEQVEGWEDYQKITQEVTGDFVQVSKGVREVEAQLSQSRPDLAGMVRALQELEKQKLQLTAKVQAGREKAVFVSEKVDKEVDWTWEREEKSIKNQLNTLIEEINLIIDSFRLELNELSSEVTE